MDDKTDTFINGMFEEGGGDIDNNMNVIENNDRRLSTTRRMWFVEEYSDDDDDDTSISDNRIREEVSIDGNATTQKQHNTNNRFNKDETITSTTTDEYDSSSFISMNSNVEQEQQPSSSMIMTLTNLTDNDIERKLIDNIERSILSYLLDDYDDNNIIDIATSSNETNKECKGEEVNNVTDDNDNDDNDECNKSYGSRGMARSDDEDDLYEGFVSNRRHSMLHFLEDDLDELIETDTRRPWRRQELLFMHNESTTTLITSNKKLITTNDNIIDQGIILNYDDDDDHDNNVNAMIDNNSLQDSSYCSSWNTNNDDALTTTTDARSHISLAKRALTAFNNYYGSANNSHSTNNEQKSLNSTNSTTQISTSSSNKSFDGDKRISFMFNGDGKSTRHLNMVDDNTTIITPTSHSFNNHEIESNHSSHSNNSYSDTDNSNLFNFYNNHNSIKKEEINPSQNSINACNSMIKHLKSEEEQSSSHYIEDYKSDQSHSNYSVNSDQYSNSKYTINSIPALVNNHPSMLATTTATTTNFYQKNKCVVFLWLSIVMLGLCFSISYLIINGQNNNNNNSQLPTSTNNEQKIILWNILIEKHILDDDEIQSSRTTHNKINAQSFFSSLALSSDGNTLIYNTQNNEINFYNALQNETQRMSSTTIEYPDYTISKLAISGNNGASSCIAKLLKNNDLTLLSSLINIQKYSSDGSVWTSFANKLFEDVNIESISMSNDCKRISLGIPNYSHINGINSGLVQVYDIIEDNSDNDDHNNIFFKQIGQNITGEQPYYHTGNDVSFSHDGTTLAISSPNANINENNSGQVTLYKLNNNSNQWEKIFEMSGAVEEDLLGSSMSLSASGERIAIGSKGHTSGYGQCQVFQLVNETSWIKLGTTIHGESKHDEIGSIFELSGDGNRLFIPFNETWNIYSWNDDNVNDWNNIGYLPASFAPKIISSSYNGNRLAIGDGENIISFYEFEQMSDL